MLFQGMETLNNEFTDKLFAYRSSFMSFSYQGDKILKSIYTDAIEEEDYSDVLA